MLNCNVCKRKLDVKYKCPLCLIKYCSPQCYTKHKVDCMSSCTSKNENHQAEVSDECKVLKTSRITCRSLVPLEKLENLRDKPSLMDLLKNPHLCNLLKTINEAEDPEGIMQKAMQEPLFTEFADVCLSIIDPPSEDER